MNGIIESLFSLSRAARDELKIEDVDLSAIAGEVIGELRDAHPDREIDVEISGGMCCRGDPALLRQVIDNLFRNAWKFSSGKSRTRIEFRVLGGSGARRTFLVRDNGAGFDPAQVGRLFKPFQRLHSQAEFPGLGIGLASVHRIIGRLGGRIWAEGRPGRGATFYFRLGERS
jgi:signal transduction histidine kinase